MYRLIVRPEVGEDLMNIKYETKEELEKSLSEIRKHQADLFLMNMTSNLLIVIKEVMAEFEWVEYYRDSLFRQ